MKRKFKLLLSLLIFALLLCLCVGCNNSDNNSPRDDNTVIKPPKDDNTVIEPPVPDTKVELSASQIYKKVNPSVVFILLSQSGGFASGSGFFVDNNGTMVTNYHVIKDATKGVIQLYDGSQATVDKVLGYDEELDIAILSTTAHNTTPIIKATLQAQIGDTVYAIGYPKAFNLGVSSSTFTSGMVSMFRSIDGYSYIQATVDITNGNSGGVLINKYGEVIGITTAGINFSNIDYMNLSIPIQRVDNVARNVNESLEVTTKRHYPVYVTYVADGRQIDKQTIRYQSTSKAPSNPTKTGYSFVGWYTNSSFTTKFDFTKAICEDVTIYGKFEINKYSVDYNLNQGKFSSGVENTYTINDCGNVLPTPTRSGYLFEGWRDWSGQFVDNFPQFANIRSLKLYASWVSGTEGILLKNGKVVSYNGTASDVTIPSSYRNVPTTAIGESAFRNNTTIKKITVPDSVTSISSGVFSGCGSLIEITLPFIGDSAKTSSDTYQYPLGYIFGTRSYAGGVATEQRYYGYSSSSSTKDTYYIPSSLKSVTIKGGNILYGAFYNCSGLTSVTIPDRVTSIGSSAFYNCSGLTSVTIPDRVTSIGSKAFYNCAGLTSVTIGNGVTSIGNYAFQGCSGLTSITIGKNVTTIDNSTFEGCSALREIHYNGDLTGWCNINGIDNLMKCSSSTKSLYIDGAKIEGNLVIPDGVTSIGNYAFYNCSKLTYITIPDRATSIGNGVFSGCSGLTSITIPDSVTSIGDYAFDNCSGLTSITISDNVSSIGDSAFYGCNGLTTVCWNATNCTKAGSNSSPIFSNCTRLKTVVVGENVQTIPSYAFSDCSGLTEIHYNGDLNSWCSISGLDNLMQYGKSTKSLYIDGTKIEGVLVIPDSVTNIGSYAFYCCRGLTSVTIGNGVTSIGEYAFCGCTGLTSVTIPDSVTSIGNRAFEDCTDLTSVTIGNSVTSIGNDAFWYCRGLTSVSWNAENCTLVGAPSIFRECTNLTTVTIGDNVKTIPSYAFNGCSSLTSITIPDSVTSIGDDAFDGCSGLTSVTIGKGVTSIGGGAFSRCSGLTNIKVAVGNTKYHSQGNCIIKTASKTLILGCKNSVIPADGSVTSIGSSAFSVCSGLTSVTIPDGVTKIGSSAFSGCSGLTNITIPESVTSIGWGAFFGCTGLTSVTISNGVTSIGAWAFENCTDLTRIDFNGTKAQWNAIEKGNDWSHNTGSFTIYCTDGTI